MLDKADPKAALKDYASTPEQLRRDSLAKMKPEEREKLVVKTGLERWKKAGAKVEPDVTNLKTSSFVMFSKLPKGRAEAALRQMEATHKKLHAIMGPGGLDWVVKPSLFVFNDRVSFVEFVRSNEGREVEEDDRGAANFSVDEPYVAVVDPLAGQEDTTAARKPSRSKKEEDGPVSSRTLAGILSEQLAVGVLSNAGKPPRWVTLGVGAYLESLQEGASPFVQRLRAEAYRQCEQGWPAKANEALGDAAKCRGSASRWLCDRRLDGPDGRAVPAGLRPRYAPGRRQARRGHREGLER